MARTGWRRIFPQFKSASQEVETKSAHDHLFDLSREQTDFIRFGLAAGDANTPSNALRLYENSSAVSVPVGYIAGAFSAIEPVIKLIDGTIIREHAVLKLLAKPSPDYTRELFMESLARNRLVTGEAYVIALGSLKFEPSELIPISPKLATPVQGQDGFVKQFQVSGVTIPGNFVRTREPTGIRFKRDNRTEIKQIRNFSTDSNSLLRGQSPLLGVSSEVKQHVLGVHHNTRLLENGGRLSLLVSFDADMTEDDFEEAKKAIRRSLGGADNAGKIVVTTGGGMDIKEMGMSNKDMDYAKLQDNVKMSTASTYKFPLVLIFITASTYNNYEQAKLALYDDAVLPLLAELYGGLSDFLFPRYPDLPEGARLSVDEQTVTTLVSRRLDELVKRRNVNVETDNEIRALMGRDPIEGGNTVRDNASKVPIGTDVIGGPDNELLAERDGDS